VSGHKNVIELNGKLYDTVSGKIVASAASNTHQQPIVIKPQTKGTVMDGFIKKPSHAPKPHHPTPAKHTPKPHTSRPEAKTIIARTPHPAKTLVRKGLKKPSLHETTHTAHQPTIKQTSPRLARAGAVPQSPKISRFGALLSQPHSFVKKTAALPVKPAPHQSSHVKKQELSHHAAHPVLTNNQVLKEHLVSQAIKDARVTEAPHKTKRHKTAKKLGLSPKVFHFGAGTLAVLLLIGFIAYQNAPNISMRIAASRAGFNAAIPRYQPSGFGLKGPIEYGPGQVTLNFKSNSDERNFHIIQKVSNWNSDALLSNFVASNNKSYQTYQDKGRTIYIYDGSNATWVSGGSISMTVVTPRGLAGEFGIKLKETPNSIVNN
jgi:hypothetical protein